MECVHLRTESNSEVLALRRQVGHLSLGIDVSHGLSVSEIVVRADHLVWLARGTPATSPILQVESFTQVVVVDGCFWHANRSFFHVCSPSRHKCSRFGEPVCMDSHHILVRAVSTLVIVQDVVCCIPHVEHHGFTSLALPIQRHAIWGHSD
jgi:hypothetical protein